MLHKKLLAVPALALAALIVFAVGHTAYADDEGPYQKIATISVPSGFAFPGGGFDISWVDPVIGRDYIADRGNSLATPKPIPPGIDVIDTRQDKFLFNIPLASAANGVLVFRSDDGNNGSAGTLAAGLANSSLIFIDLANPFATPLAVPTGGNHRADELAYDPIDHVIVVANDQDTPHPFVTFVSTDTHALLGKIIYDGSSPQNPLSTGGIEQPVWDGAKKKFFIAIPSTKNNPLGEIDEIDPVSRVITQVFPTTCGPAGLALIPGQRLISSCGDVLKLPQGTVVTTVPGVSPADEIWYNPGDERVYFGGILTSPVASGLPSWDVVPGGLPWTGHFTPPPAQFSHSIAADSENNHIFVPVFNLGVLVFTDAN